MSRLGYQWSPQRRAVYEATALVEARIGENVEWRTEMEKLRSQLATLDVFEPRALNVYRQMTKMLEDRACLE